MVAEEALRSELQDLDQQISAAQERRSKLEAALRLLGNHHERRRRPRMSPAQRAEHLLAQIPVGEFVAVELRQRLGWDKKTFTAALRRLEDERKITFERYGPRHAKVYRRTS